MINYPNQLPTDVEFDSILPKTTTNTTAYDTVEKKFDARNYLNFTIPEGKKTLEKVIRLLPINLKEDGKPEFFQIVHLHNITVNKELNPNKSGKKAYMCLNAKNTGIDHEKYGSNCPVCEAQQALWKQWHAETDKIKKEAIIKEIKELNIREYCIVRCIERGKEDEGPKFWRIPLRQDQTDAYHKLLLLAKTRHDEGLEAGLNINIFSIYEGRDLIITFTEGNGAPTIVDKGVPTPVTKDTTLLNEWYYNEKKWSDVFSTKPYDYLKIAFEGNIPWYDKANNRWISKTDFNNNQVAEENTINSNIKAAEKQFTAPTQEVTHDTMAITPQPQPITPTIPDYSYQIPEVDDLPF